MFVQVRRTPCVRYEVCCLHFVDRLAVDVTDTDFRCDDDQIGAGNQIDDTDNAVDRTASSSIDIGQRACEERGRVCNQSAGRERVLTENLNVLLCTIDDEKLLGVSDDRFDDDRIR